MARLGLITMVVVVTIAGLWWGTRGSATAPDALGPIQGAPIRAVADIADGDVTASPPLSQKSPPEQVSVVEPAAPAPDAPQNVPSKLADKPAESLTLDFTHLAAFEYIDGQLSKAGEKGEEQIPETIRALSGREVVIEGFMFPIDLDGLQVYSFFLAGNHQACCFGASPRINEIIVVNMKDGTRYLPDLLVRVTGTFEVGEDRDKFGNLTSVYRLEAESVTQTWSL